MVVMGVMSCQATSRARTACPRRRLPTAARHRSKTASRNETPLVVSRHARNDKRRLALPLLASQFLQGGAQFFEHLLPHRLVVCRGRPHLDDQSPFLLRPVLKK